MAKKRAAKKIYKSDDPDDNMPQRSTKDIADKHAVMERDELQQAKMDRLGNNEQGKELFDFVLKGMSKPYKK